MKKEDLVRKLNKAWECTNCGNIFKTKAVAEDCCPN